MNLKTIRRLIGGGLAGTAGLVGARELAKATTPPHLAGPQFYSDERGNRVHNPGYKVGKLRKDIMTGAGALALGSLGALKTPKIISGIARRGAAKDIKTVQSLIGRTKPALEKTKLDLVNTLKTSKSQKDLFEAERRFLQVSKDLRQLSKIEKGFESKIKSRRASSVLGLGKTKDIKKNILDIVSPGRSKGIMGDSSFRRNYKLDSPSYKKMYASNLNTKLPYRKT